MTIPMIRSLAALSARYDGYIVDIWGVVHQGGPAFPEAVRCLQRLREAGKRVVFLSNAPRRAVIVAAILEAKGIAAALHDGVISSGEAARLALAARDEPALAALGPRYLLLGPAASDDLLDGLDYRRTDDLATADFLLGIGLDAHRPTVAAHEPGLRAAADRGLIMLCVNPDIEVVRLGTREPCAGALAVRYEALGGKVHYFGKPHPAVYALSLERLGVADRRRVLAVGDGPATDIEGAHGAGLDSLLITGGLLAAELGIARVTVPDPAALNAACAAFVPDAALPTLAW